VPSLNWGRRHLASSSIVVALRATLQQLKYLRDYWKMWNREEYCLDVTVVAVEVRFPGVSLPNRCRCIHALYGHAGLELLIVRFMFAFCLLSAYMLLL